MIEMASPSHSMDHHHHHRDKLTRLEQIATENPDLTVLEFLEHCLKNRANRLRQESENQMKSLEKKIDACISEDEEEETQ
mmetsp:Transcript_1802/g.1900  ORF Transcript_1802/g.1900 Transcript_1802/m.1900 type:complete len:80 (-) Transcript_1802:104-343(-)